jgi:Eukaryotic aspartyl protease
MIAAKVTNMQFGVGVDATSTEGVMGVGFALNEAILQFPGTQPYPNLVDQLVSQKLIQSRTYSLYLDDIEASTGQILFGGVDTSKFSGTLATFPINTDDTGTASQFVITLTGLSLTTPSSTSGVGSSSLYPLSVLLDSGSSYMSLPSAMVQAIAKSMGASFSNQLGGYILPNCNSQFASGSLNFFFSGVQISIPYDEFIVNPTATDGSDFLYGNGSPVCMLGLIPGSSDDIAVLGDTFLRSAYVVYDLVHLPSLKTNNRIIKKFQLRNLLLMLLQVMYLLSPLEKIKFHLLRL